MSDLARCHVRIEGRVQGVGFRYFAQDQASALGLRGWVTNMPHGDVEAVAEGPKAELEKWIAALRQGPPLSRVTHVHVQWDAPEESLPSGEGFRIH
jgi:acylphosphatase